MKLYFFSYWNGTLTREIKEVEEKPKTYRISYGYGYNQYRKEDVGKVDGCTVFLLEDSVEKARELFLGKMQDDINRQKFMISNAQERLMKMESELENLKKGNFEMERRFD